MSGISAKSKALAIVPKFTGFLSFSGSLFVIYDIVRCNSTVNGNTNTLKRNSIFHRIMLGLSTFDCIASFVNIMSTWPTPSDQSDFIFGASGTTATCTAQGFFNEFGNITTPLYSAALCVWYLLLLKYGWKEEDCKKFEVYFHIIPITVGLSMAVAGLPLTLYNNSGFLCWYAPYPAGCTKTDPHTCTRGEMAGTFRWIHYGIIWSAIAFVTYAMSSIYITVRKQEKVAIERHSILSNTSRKKSRAVAIQALLYVCALYLTWAFTTSLRISQTVFKHNSYVLLMCMATFFPLQGFWNALIYFRPRYQQSRKPTKRSSFFTSTKHSEEPKSAMFASKHSEHDRRSSSSKEHAAGLPEEHQADLEECAPEGRQT